MGTPCFLETETKYLDSIVSENAEIVATFEFGMSVARPFGWRESFVVLN
jgi:hypothetical protein